MSGATGSCSMPPCPQLAKFASDYVLHKPVIDQTGLEGSFDYRDPDVKIDQDNGDFEGCVHGFYPGHWFETHILERPSRDFRD